MSQQKTIMSFERGLKILEILCASFRPLTLTEVAQRMDLNLAATQRFLNTLCATGYVNRDKSKGYSPSAKILSLGVSFLGDSTLAKIVIPYLEMIYSELHETINLTVLDVFEIVQIYRREGLSVLKYDFGPGSRLPAHCTATGKMLLAGLTDDELGERIRNAELAAVTPNTITSKKELMAEIRKIRSRGFSISDRELSMDLFSVAVPLHNDKGATIAAINVTAGFFNIEMKKPKIIELLIQKGEEISRRMGYQGPYPVISKRTYNQD